ncbi:Dickkopf-related protein 1 [Salmo salar]|uniref:Dickkopf-related protein 1 n=1 Tax=Salmo salar TaxID=8030 RepID=B5XFA4_SALSA|nr:Dickkopf-related protein 1 [Salmo salar]ACI69524.1 Dickkopf-related protein 1 precursor [Salmo salar]|eukprot:NP_001134928.1 Dickkopf-related protein 1 [Salmo salar]
MRSAVTMVSAWSPEVPVSHARSAGSAVSGTLCAALATSAVMACVCPAILRSFSTSECQSSIHMRRTLQWNCTPNCPHKIFHNPSKGLVGENCLRSSDCTEGLCCARHFWSKICKPVVKDGQVCTKHQRKGTHGLEIFQRCDCGDGLSCRTQRGEHNSKASRSLHTCQRH